MISYESFSFGMVQAGRPTFQWGAKELMIRGIALEQGLEFTTGALDSNNPPATPTQGLGSLFSSFVEQTIDYFLDPGE